jgi:predicted ATPase
LISARDKDFQEALLTNSYGNNYFDLANRISQFLSGKKIFLKEQLSKIVFQSSDGITELQPEDLSHGELKRLSIYLWLLHKEIGESIVFMDEVEIALHPDWQYQIVADLEQWAVNNQYILATHSYELCNALTPNHVKELEPRLPNPFSRNV